MSGDKTTKTLMVAASLWLAKTASIPRKRALGLLAWALKWAGEDLDDLKDVRFRHEMISQALARCLVRVDEEKTAGTWSDSKPKRHSVANLEKKAAKAGRRRQNAIARRDRKAEAKARLEMSVLEAKISRVARGKEPVDVNELRTKAAVRKAAMIRHRQSKTEGPK